MIKKSNCLVLIILSEFNNNRYTKKNKIKKTITLYVEDNKR